MVDEARERDGGDRHGLAITAVHEAEADRLRALGAMVVHDLGNAVFAITGRTQLLERRAPDEATKASAREILASVRMLEELLGRLRSACRAPVAEPKASTDSTLRGTLAGACASLGSMQDVFASLAAESPADARCDVAPDDLSRALAQCLAAHARWGEPNPGPTIAATTGDDAVATIRLESKARDGAPDGFAPPSLLAGEPDLAQIGLLAAQRAIRESGGRVAWEIDESAVARRLRTTVTVPIERGIPLRQDDRVRPAGTHGTTPGCDGPPAAPAPRRVLIADDDPAVRAILVAVLESVGDEVDTIDDPSAIAGRDDLDAFDVAILDAGGGGLAALDRLRARGSDLPVLLASGDLVERADDPRTRTALKPLELKELDRALAELASLRQRG